MSVMTLREWTIATRAGTLGFAAGMVFALIVGGWLGWG